jgi:hypothetical protein
MILLHAHFSIVEEVDRAAKVDQINDASTLHGQ